MTDRELDKAIRKAIAELAKRPENNRGPFVLTDEMLKAMK